MRPTTERRICRAVAELEKQAIANAQLRQRYQRGAR